MQYGTTAILAVDVTDINEYSANISEVNSNNIIKLQWWNYHLNYYALPKKSNMNNEFEIKISNTMQILIHLFIYQTHYAMLTIW